MNFRNLEASLSSLAFSIKPSELYLLNFECWSDWVFRWNAFCFLSSQFFDMMRIASLYTTVPNPLHAYLGSMEQNSPFHIGIFVDPSLLQIFLFSHASYLKQ